MLLILGVSLIYGSKLLRVDSPFTLISSTPWQQGAKLQRRASWREFRGTWGGDLTRWWFTLTCPSVMGGGNPAWTDETKAKLVRKHQRNDPPSVKCCGGSIRMWTADYWVHPCIVPDNARPSVHQLQTSRSRWCSKWKVRQNNRGNYTCLFRGIISSWSNALIASRFGQKRLLNERDVMFPSAALVHGYGSSGSRFDHFIFSTNTVDV